MENKRKRPVRKPKAIRFSLAGRIAAAANTDPGKALALANYGSDGEAVLGRMAHRDVPASFRPRNEAGLSEFIQDWLFLEMSRTDPWLKEQRRNDHASFTLKQNNLEIETHIFFGDKISTGDWKFFHKFADKLKAEVSYFDATRLKNRSPIHAELLGAKLWGNKANISKMADELVENEFPKRKRPESEAARKKFDYDKANRRKNIFRSASRIAARLNIEIIADPVGRKSNRTDKPRAV